MARSDGPCAVIAPPCAPRNLRRDLERATVEMSAEEAAEYEQILSMRQTGDVYVRPHSEGAVEMETYVLRRGPHRRPI